MGRDDKVRAMLSSFITDDPEFLDAASACCHLVSHSAGQTIMSREDPETTVFLVTEGQARALIYSEDGHETWLGDFQAGDIIGDMAALLEDPRSANIVAVTDARLISVSGTAFLELMKNHGSFALAVARILAERVRVTSQRMFQMSALSAQARIYAELVRMSRPIDPAEPSIRQIKPAPVYSEFAKWVNSTRETVSRTISQLEKQNRVKRTEEALIVYDRDREI